MKLSSLYSNRPDQFGPLHFVSGLNVVLAEIRVPENRKKDTHNLGKSTLGRLLDFCFLAGRESTFFLFKHLDLFRDFTFFLELELADASYLTIRRSVRDASRISFKKHAERNQDFSDCPEARWDHYELPFEKAREMLDALLDWRALRPWTFRNGLGYLLRSQNDYRDVFQLARHQGPHSTWKPFLAHILGFDAQLIVSHYEREAEKKKKEDIAQTVKSELGGSVEDISKIEGMLLLKQKEVGKKQSLIDTFDFRAQDKAHIKQLVGDLDERIAVLNAEKYSLSLNRKKIIAALEDDQILFNPDEAQDLFQQAGVLFGGQIKRDFEQLIEFNRAITVERQQYLRADMEELEATLKTVNTKLNDLGKQRAQILSFLSDTDIFNKYKSASDELVTLRADIIALERQRKYLHRLQELRAELRALDEQLSGLQVQIETDVEKQNSDETSRFSIIRLFFSEIIEEVIDRKALISVSPNALGHLEFKVEILDESGNSTSADSGHTYRKLLCVAFDLAVLRAHLDSRFPRFVFHDGVFESLDDRKKESLLAVLRQYADAGLQSIITLIDSDLPTRDEQDGPVFDDNEIICLLHDENEQGRLFRMKPW
ncbi:MAG: hypothetical protein AMXMBFR4_30090 [Candidatus Hydrogenedentota bacterium]